MNTEQTPSVPAADASPAQVGAGDGLGHPSPTSRDRERGLEAARKQTTDAVQVWNEVLEKMFQREMK